MKAKRWISLLLAVSMMLGVLAMPAKHHADRRKAPLLSARNCPMPQR